MAFLAGALASASVVPAAARLSPVQALPSVILDRATNYVAEYVKALSSVVSEERYEQVVTRHVTRGAAPPEKRIDHRTLVSDYLLVQVPGSSYWEPFRDVYSVDGSPVRDRDDRLLKLFLAPGAGAVARALQIKEESSRYNIGGVTRDINVPTFALQILTRDVRDRFAFTQRGRERVGETDTVVIEFLETAPETLIRGRDYEDVPSRGRFHVEPESGAVVRSVIETRPPGVRTRIEVTYRLEPKLGMLVPGEMIERHDLTEELVEARSSYSNFRRFSVDATFEIK